jgi:hypothetical protein
VSVWFNQWEGGEGRNFKLISEQSYFKKKINKLNIHVKRKIEQK